VEFSQLLIGGFISNNHGVFKLNAMAILQLKQQARAWLAA
jgi:hypothetical protein